MKQIGKVIYLESSFEKIIEALKNAPDSKKKFKKRPLLKDLKEAKKIYKTRVDEYKKVADMTVNVEDWNIERIVTEILEKIN